MKLLSVQDAQARILKHIRPVQTETLPLAEATDRVLASDIPSTDLPLFDNSSVDGFAVIAADVAEASPEAPRRLQVIADIPAGRVSDRALHSGEAARIMTGATVPAGADSVLMVEDTDFGIRDSNSPVPPIITIFKPVKSGENIRRRGMDLKSGRNVLRVGCRVRPQDAAMLAMLGHAQAHVFRRPRVALFSSGDELVTPGATLSPGKIRETNSYMLAAQTAGVGCEILSLGIAPDQPKAITRFLDKAIELGADAILSSAGVSVGAFDFVRDAITANGRLDFWGVNVRPGKPLAVGDYRGVPFIGLPGNPVSAFVGFELFVRPAWKRLAGEIPADRFRIPVILAEPVESDGRESYLRAIAWQESGSWRAKLTGHQGSGNLHSLVEANALLIVPAGVKSLAVGGRVEAVLL
jgi:molybdopterin molybdotransferase